MILYPAIDIRGGQVVRLEQGDYDRETAHDADPIDAARRWRAQGARILHVEDDESLTQLVEELLSDEAEVVPAHSLAQAQASIEAQRFDLVILDAVLGDGSGLDLLPTLHEAGDAATPIILYSATEPSRELAERVQAALVKSRDSVEHLLATVRRLARRHTVEEAASR